MNANTRNTKVIKELEERLQGKLNGLNDSRLVGIRQRNCMDSLCVLGATRDDAMIILPDTLSTELWMHQPPKLIFLIQE